MSSTQSTKKLFFVAAILQIVWGIVPSASNVVISEIPVELYIAIRWTISSAIFLCFLGFNTKWVPTINKNSLRVMFLGILGYGLGSFGTLYGLKIGGVTNFALMSALSPVVASSVSILVLRERPAKLFFITLPICVLGLVLLVNGKHEVSSWTIAFSSSALIVGAEFLEAIVFVYSKKLKVNFTAIQYLAISQLAAAIFMWVLQLGVFKQIHLVSQLSAKGWGSTIFVSLVACVLCYSVLYWLLNHVDGHKLALFDGLHAVSAAIFGWCFFSETLNGLMIFGGAILLLGLVMGNLSHKTDSAVPAFNKLPADGIL